MPENQSPFLPQLKKKKFLETPFPEPSIFLLQLDSCSQTCYTTVIPGFPTLVLTIPFTSLCAQSPFPIPMSSWSTSFRTFLRKRSQKVMFLLLACLQMNSFYPYTGFKLHQMQNYKSLIIFPQELRYWPIVLQLSTLLLQTPTPF